MYWSRGLFLWMVQRKSRIRNLKPVDGTTQGFGSGAFRVWKFQSCLLAKYFISANSRSCSDINCGQTGGDLSFGVPYPFQRHWPHGVFHQKMRRSRNLQFLNVTFGSFGFFLTSTFPASKHHQTCTLLQSASLFQLQKLLDPASLYAFIFSSFFFESTPSAWAVCADG